MGWVRNCVVLGVAVLAMTGAFVPVAAVSPPESPGGNGAADGEGTSSNTDRGDDRGSDGDERGGQRWSDEDAERDRGGGRTDGNRGPVDPGRGNADRRKDGNGDRASRTPAGRSGRGD